MVSGSGVVNSETTALLQTRLRAVTLVFSLAALVFLVRDLWTGTALAPLLHILLVAALVGMTVLLWRPWKLCLKTLRVFEALIFACVAAQLAVQDYYLISAEAVRGNDVLVLSKLVKSVLHYALLAMAYGIFIPGTWQRSAAVVIPLAVAPPLVVGTLLFRLHPEVALAASRPGFSGEINDAVLSLIVGVFISIYGTHVINRYRAAAFETKDMGLYQLKQKIGEGGMGEVWLVVHRMLARPAAMKLIRPERLAGDNGGATHQALRRFEREAQATALLRSPHTVELYDFGMTQEGVFYYVMEFLNGLDLDTLVHRFGPLSYERMIYLLRQACNSLADAHQNGLIHRDIKPSNVYVCRMGLLYDFVKVLDFGLVKWERTDGQETQLTVEGLTTGTPAYMAPELALNQSKVDARADIYALGGVGYWLLTGQLIFQQQSPMAMVVDHVKTPPVPPSQRTELTIPEEMDAIILKCLEKDPDRRFQNVLELETALASCLGSGDWNSKRAEMWWKLHLPNPADQFLGAQGMQASPSPPSS